jgi:hypothetical protein
MPPPLAHHAGEQSLATLLLLGSSGALSVVVAIGRAHLRAALSARGGRLPGMSGRITPRQFHEAAGGRLVSDRHAPSSWTLADAEGNEVDVATWLRRD